MPKAVAAKETPVVFNVATQAPPAPPEKTNPQEEPHWFFEKINQITPDEWQKSYTLELIRLEPKVPGVPGSKGFLDVFTEPISRAEIRKKFGGGKFNLLLLKNSRFVTSHMLDIEGDPIYQRGRELPQLDGKNGAGLEGRLLNMLESNLKEMKEELREREATSGPDPALEKAITMLSTAYSTALGTVQGNNANPTGNLKDLLETVKAMGIIGNADAGIVGTIKVLKELGLIGSSSAPANPLEQLKTFMEIFEKMDALRGESSNGKGRGWKEIAAEKLADAVPTILERMQPAARRHAPAGPPRPSVQPNGPAPVPMPRAPLPARPAPPAPPPAGFRIVPESEIEQTYSAAAAPSDGQPSSSEPAESPAAVEVLPPEDFAEQIAYVRGVKRRLVAAVVNAALDGDDGARIVDFLETAWPEAVTQLETFTAEQITEYFHADEILRHAVERPAWPRILGEAQAYLREDVPVTP